MNYLKFNFNENKKMFLSRNVINLTQNRGLFAKFSTSKPENTASDAEPEASKVENELETKFTKQIAYLEEKLEDMKSKNLRLFADIDNMQRRHSAQLDSLSKYASEKVFLSFAEVFEEIMGAGNTYSKLGEKNKNFKSLLEALGMIQKNFSSKFTKHSVEILQPKPGENFDLASHEALGVEKKTSEEQKEGTIASTCSIGLKLHDKVIKPVLVKVYK